jgi:hypothetical protein
MALDHAHFFQDLVETGTAYAALFPESRHCQYQPQQLPAAEPLATNADAAHQAVSMHDLNAQALQLQGDVVSQQLVCYFEH